MRNTKDLYVVFSGKIKSKHDGDIHHVSARQVARLHNLKEDQWIEAPRRSIRFDSSEYKEELYPKNNGNYKDLSCLD